MIVVKMKMKRMVGTLKTMAIMMKRMAVTMKLKRMTVMTKMKRMVVMTKMKMITLTVIKWMM